jgi:hypothetical protein
MGDSSWSEISLRFRAITYQDRAMREEIFKQVMSKLKQANLLQQVTHFAKEQGKSVVSYLEEKSKDPESIDCSTAEGQVLFDAVNVFRYVAGYHCPSCFSYKNERKKCLNCSVQGCQACVGTNCGKCCLANTRRVEVYEDLNNLFQKEIEKNK